MKRIKKSSLAVEIIFLLMTIVTWIPIYYLIIGAFKTRDDIIMYPLTIDFEKFTLQNFSNAWKSMEFMQSFSNTFLITVGALLIIIIASSLAGFALARIPGKIFSVYYAVIVALMVAPFISCLLPLVRQMRGIDLYNTRIGAILIHSAWHLPFCIFLYTGFMKALPKELEEAAYIDGCSTTQIYAKIFLPLLTPVTATCCIRSGMTIWNDFLIGSTVLNGSKLPTLIVSINSFFGKYVNEYGYAFAGIILATLPIALLFVFLQKYFVAGMVAGAVKG